MQVIVKIGIIFGKQRNYKNKNIACGKTEGNIIFTTINVSNFRKYYFKCIKTFVDQVLKGAGRLA